MKEGFYPQFSLFKKLRKKGNIIPVYKEILADWDTPVSIFKKLSKGNTHAYLLESIEGGERWGRYSFISSHPAQCIQIYNDRVVVLKGTRVVQSEKTDDPLGVLKQILKAYRPVELPGLPRFWGGLVGYLGYDIIRSIEDIPDRHAPLRGIPDGIFMVTDHLIIFDHVSHRVKVVVCVHGDKKINARKAYMNAIRKIQLLIKKINGSTTHSPRKRRFAVSSVRSNMSKHTFMNAVRKAKEYIRNGHIIQVVLSQRFSTRLSVTPFDVYRALRVINPSPYLFYLKMGDLHLVGSSPEILVRKEGTRAELRPIAGTRKRGKTVAQDKKLAEELLADPKELAEHVMLVDLARNDLGRVCRYKSIHLPDVKIIEKYSHVMHIVSSVIGRLKNRTDAIDVLKATFPAGTVAGAPKIRAMEIIDELEVCRRGPYAGAVGYFSFAGNMDMAITIRTIVVKGRDAWIQAGAGIVADSVPGREFHETKNKAAALLSAIRVAENGLP